MTVLQDYATFSGLHWETGSVHNVFASRGIMAPHTGQPYSEALLMGVSGGAVMGYFSFAYEGYDPQAHILTRNTFDPLDRLLERLGIVQNVRQTGSADKAEAILLETLENGEPAIVWADMWSLPYNALDYDEGMWGMFPVVVYGLDRASDCVMIADRAQVSLTVTPDELRTARARVKKDRFRLLTLEPPREDKLVAAVQAGIWDCIKLYTEAPPKGSKHNFGLLAFERLATLLTKPKTRQSWAKEFPAGIKLYAGLTSLFNSVALFGQGGSGDAERGLYAGFLEEASTLLNRPALQEPAALFRQSGAAWQVFSTMLLPEAVAPLAEARTLLLQRHVAFHTQGNAALDEIRAIDGQLADLRASMATDFPLDEDGVSALQAELATQLLAIREIEAQAIAALQAAM